MLTRRDMLQVSAAALGAMSGLSGPGVLARAAARQTITQSSLLRFRPVGTVTLLHFTDLHAQLVPLYYREPSVNLGVGANQGRLPHLTGPALLSALRIPPDSAGAYAFSAEDFTALARTYGRVGGIDRLATLIRAIKSERPDNTLVLDGGDTLQGSWTALQTQGADMARAVKALGVDAWTGHWEFTYGAQRVREVAAGQGYPFLCGNIRDTEWDEEVFQASALFERGGVSIAVIGQAFPYTPVANPRWLVPDWSFGIREDSLRDRVKALRDRGAQLVVLLSHNGFDVDRKLAAAVPDLDVILSGHTHDAIPEAIRVGKTLLISSGSHGKFLGRLDLDVRDGGVKAHAFRLIPVFADAIDPDPDMAQLVTEVRAPYLADLARVVGHTDDLLYRRGNFNGTWDDLICQALMAERDAEIALSPGFRWGPTLLPGQAITAEDVYAQTAITYPNAYRAEMTGADIKAVLEDVADNLFNPDPYYQQGGDMVRVGGLSYSIAIDKPIGQRIGDLIHLKSGRPLEATRRYSVAGWASVTPGTQGPPVWDVVFRHLEQNPAVDIPPPANVTLRPSGA
jgi:S-sulfosulfanyl-L-cysteine sulfohydrolase